MSIVEPTLLSLARAAAVSLATLIVLLVGGPGVQSWSRIARTIMFWGGMAALLAPGFAAALIGYEASLPRESLDSTYCTYIFGRYFLATLLALWIFPAGMSDEAVHVLRLNGFLRWQREFRAWGRGLWAACALIFMLVFQEFEVAATWNLRAWTVSIFDAQAGGLALSDSLRLTLLPFGIMAGLLMLTLCMRPPAHLQRTVEFKIVHRSGLILFPAAVGWCLFALFPVLILGRSVDFIPKVTSPLALVPWREVLHAAIISGVATWIAWFLAGWIERRRGWRWTLALPGLFGPLLCGLLLLTVIQMPPLHLLRDTIFPTVLGLALVLLPYALLLRFGIETTRDRMALYLAHESGGRSALWQLDGWPRLCAVLLLFCFGYGDFTINTLLAPPQFTSVSARLLNLLHYGRSDALMAMFILAFTVPLAAALLTALAAQLYPRRRAS